LENDVPTVVVLLPRTKKADALAPAPASAELSRRRLRIARQRQMIETRAIPPNHTGVESPTNRATRSCLVAFSRRPLLLIDPSQRHGKRELPKPNERDPL